MAIRKIHELELKKSLSMLIYGQKGVGKTTLALSADTNCLLIDTDNGIDRVNVEHLLTSSFIQTNNYSELLLDLEGNIQEYSTIIIDTAGKLLEYMIEYIRSSNSKMSNPLGGLSMQGWGVLNNTFRLFNNKLKSINKYIIFVAHEVAEKRSDNTRLIPDLRVNNYSILATELDLIGYIECIGNERTISFNPTSEHDGKNTGGFEPVIKIPELKSGANNDFLQKHIIQKHFYNLEQKEKMQKVIADKFREIDSIILSINDANDANELIIERIDTIEHIGTSKNYMRIKFKERLKQLLNVTYNKETKLYE